MTKVVARLGVLALALALVLVPTIARARQHVERRDATRLSIKHSWLGVAPPTKASVSPQPVVVLPALAVPPEEFRSPACPLVAAAAAPRTVLDDSSDPLRGPPSTPLV